MDIDELVDSVAETPKVGATEDLMRVIESEIDAFDLWFQSPTSSGGCGEGPLVRPEKAIIRTYLFARMTGRFPSSLPASGTSSPGAEASPQESPTSPSRG